ncbi:hypothetical protein DH2020_033455 [Rehmannia glutinosa]|uniref:RING-type E3 ubiquitin transferase n=1 Tax=Rehmannia glutinosa TaxID=99300 RepID=A0ABR0VCA1_REHGL
MIDMEADQQGRLHPEPCIFYGSVPNFPQPNIHPVVPAAGNHCNFNFHHMPERRDGALFYGMPQHPATNLDLAIAPPSGHYNPYMAPHLLLEISLFSYGRSIPYMDTFKRKNAEGIPGNFQYHNPSAGPSSSAMPSESEYGGNDPTSMVESGSQVSMRNRPGFMGPDLVQGNFVAPPVGLPGNPWLDVHFGANNGDVGSFGWTHAPLPYVHGNCLANVNGASNRSSSGFMHPPLPQGHLNHPHHPPPPMQGVRGYNVNLPSQVAASSRRISTISSSNNGITHFQEVVDVRPTFLAPVPPAGFRLYRPQQREIILDSSARHQTLPQLRVLPEDEVAMLEFPGYHEPGDSSDQHRDMRLDIDHMSYEELLALGEQIGSVGTGLPEEFVRDNLKVRTFSSSATCFNLEEETCLNQQINFCVICQNDYEDGEDIGTVDCGHEYHRDCIKRWLIVKNTCPVCKSTALSRKAKDL